MTYLQAPNGTQAKNRLAKTTFLLAATQIAAAAAATVPDTWRKDDEKEPWWRDYINNLGENVLDNLNPLNLLPVFKDIMSIWEGYSVERMDMEGISQLINFTQKIGKGIRNGEDKDYWLRVGLKDGLQAVSTLTGISAYNVARDVVAIINSATGTRVGAKDLTGSEKAWLMYNAALTGDAETYEKYRGEFAADGATDGEIAGKVAQVIAQQDIRAAQAARAKLEGDYDEYERLIEDMTESGFTRDEAIKAYEKYVGYAQTAAGARLDGDDKTYQDKLEAMRESGMSEEEVEACVDLIETDTDKEPSESKPETLYSNADAVKASRVSGAEEANKIIDKIRKEKAESGTDAKKANSSLRAAYTDAYKDEYIAAHEKENTAEEARLKGLLSALDLGESSYGEDDFKVWEKEVRKYKSSDIVDAALNDKSAEEVKKLIAAMQDEAKTKWGEDPKKTAQTIRTALTKAYKPLYKVADESKRREIRQYLYSFKLGYDSNDFAGWTKENS